MKKFSGSIFKTEKRMKNNTKINTKKTDETIYADKKSNEISLDFLSA
jgi:hypothetical protein